MSNFIGNGISPVVTAMVAKDKGDFSNRTQCAKEQVGNCAKYNFANAALIGGGYLGGRHVLKSEALTKKFVGAFNWLTGKISKVAPKIANKLKNMSGKSKVIALIALPVAAAVTYLLEKQMFKIGQTDQKYTDKAKIEKSTNVL